MPLVGLHCSHEQISPRDLLAAVRHAEQAGLGTLDVELGAYGYLWLRVRREGERALS